MVGDDFVKALLVQIAWRDCQKFGFANQVGVLLCLRNQTEQLYDGNWLAAVNHTLAGDTFLDALADDVRDPNFQKLLQAVDGVYDGTRTDKLTDGALWWRVPDSLSPVGAERTAVVGRVVYYKKATAPTPLDF
jgi:hypothetical protein